MRTEILIFDVFDIIRSETDYLPLKAQRSLWAPAALVALEPEFKHTEEWAKSFVPQACRNLVVCFSIKDGCHCYDRVLDLFFELSPSYVAGFFAHSSITAI